jgi:5-carboxymethyl-2-hydroxymuconate isomerase
MKWRWNRTMLNLCGIVVAIFKIATGRNFSISGINSGHHNLPTYEMALKLDNVDFLWYCGGHFQNGNR